MSNIIDFKEHYLYKKGCERDIEYFRREADKDKDNVGKLMLLCYFFKLYTTGISKGLVPCCSFPEFSELNMMRDFTDAEKEAIREFAFEKFKPIVRAHGRNKSNIGLFKTATLQADYTNS